MVWTPERDEQHLSRFRFGKITRVKFPSPIASSRWTARVSCFSDSGCKAHSADLASTTCCIGVASHPGGLGRGLMTSPATWPWMRAVRVT
jgi:hypothetical protein